MSRADLNYSERRELVHVAGGFDPDVPIEGHYRMRLRIGAVFSAVRIWFGPPLDPETGEEMDRGYRWQATVNGDLVDLERVWPRCAADGITKDEHDYLLSLKRWGEEHDPDGPFANPHKPVDLLKAPLPW